MSAKKSGSNKDMGGLKVINSGAPTAGSADAVRQIDLETTSTSDRSRTNHTGTQTAASVSDFDTQVRTNRITQLAAPLAGGTDPFNLNNSEITNIKIAGSDSSAAQWGQVKDLISGQRKTDVRLVQTANSAPLTGLAVIDGVTPVAGDRILVIGNGTANGIYVASATAWARAADADVAGEFATQWLVTIREGAGNADTLFQHTTDGVVTLGTTTLTFNKIGPIASAAVNGFVGNSPSVAAGGTWTVNHALGTTDVHISVKRTGAPMDYIDVYVDTLDVNNVRVMPDISFASGEYRVLVTKAIS